SVRADLELPELDSRPVPEWSAFRTATSIRSEDGLQAVVLHRAPPAVAARVTGISRVVAFGPDRLFPLASVKQLLIDKYGAPQENAERYMVWIPAMSEGA